MLDSLAMAAPRLHLFYHTYFKTLLILLFLGLILFAWTNRFIQDDAFISFKYAQNLARGAGLVWNEGERVEGYTNFLWVLLMSVPIRLGRDPVAFSFLVGIILYTLSLIFTYRLALHFLKSQTAALLTVLLLGTNYTFSSYATGGLETQLQCCLLLASLHHLTRLTEQDKPYLSRWLLLSTLLGLSILTRPDSLLPASVIFAIALLLSLKRGVGQRQRLLSALCLIAPITILVGGWLIWKVQYYGEILPNSYHVKVGSRTSATRGLSYVYAFFRSYWLIPHALLLVFFFRKLFNKSNLPLLIPTCITLLWLLYTIKVGGDFMEFRFLVPVLPLIFILFGWVIFVELRNFYVQIVLVALVVAGSWHHARTFVLQEGIDDIRVLNDWVKNRDYGWERIGEVLGEAFKQDNRVRIGVNAAGVIPYRSGLTTVDMLGLNDKWVARNGIIDTDRPGHQRHATYNYLVERGVNLVIGHPQLEPMDKPFNEMLNTDNVLARFSLSLPHEYKDPVELKVIEIPISAKYKLLALYLVKSPLVDEAIKHNNWKVGSVTVRAG
jgi:arabinofuranosyltransferase